jgi:acyl-CoA thioester hydrolase
MSRTPPPTRAEYRFFHQVTTRWMDNDVFRHVNNVNYFSFFDTAVTYWELTHGGVDLVDGDVHCVVAEVQCRYHASVSFPDLLTVGLRVARLGSSSVRYELAIFRNEEDMASAEGYFVHVFVARGAQRPVPIPALTRERLEKLLV